MTQKTWIESKADIVWEAEGVRFALVDNKRGYPGQPNWYCGYCIFPKRPLIESGYDGIASYVPVHGGITLSDELADGQMVYGFDCAHAGDEDNPQVRDVEWLKAECQRMAAGILAAAGVEQDYLLARTNEAKAEVISRYHNAMSEIGIDFDLQNNFGALIKTVFGNL